MCKTKPISITECEAKTLQLTVQSICGFHSVPSGSIRQNALTVIKETLSSCSILKINFPKHSYDHRDIYLDSEQL